MLRNYIKITLKVLARNKFFSFISLFGISFTLLILMVIAAFWDNSFGHYGVEKDFDRTMVINSLNFENKEEGHNSQSNPSFYFIREYIRPMKSPELVAMSSGSIKINLYVGDQGLKLSAKFTDSNFWEALHFNFLNGRNYRREEVEQNAAVAVISEKTAMEFFGTVDCLGQKIKYSRSDYEVIGVVEHVNSSRKYSSADIYLPMTPFLLQEESKQELKGSAVALVVMPYEKAMENGRQEYAGLISNFQMPAHMSKFKTVESFAYMPHEGILGEFMNLSPEDLPYFYLAAVLMLTLFMLLPAINLVNINISRMMERSSEIGVRKAFGASSAALVNQFVIENIIITLVGGIIGLLLTLPVMKGINASDFIPGLELSMNLQLFGQAFLLILIFGLISGVYPAYRMSKLEIVKALNTDQK